MSLALKAAAHEKQCHDIVHPRATLKPNRVFRSYLDTELSKYKIYDDTHATKHDKFHRTQNQDST
jgi:hypothetical protein